MAQLSLRYFLLVAMIMSCDEIKETKLGPGEIRGTREHIPFSGLGTEGPQLSTPKMSPTGRYVAYTILYPDEIASTVYVVDLATSKKKFLTYGSTPDWSPDGQWIVFDQGPITKIKLDGDSLTLLTPPGPYSFPDWSPDGNWIAYDKSLADQNGPAGLWTSDASGLGMIWHAGGGLPDWVGTCIVGLSQTFNFQYKLTFYDFGQGVIKDSLLLPNESVSFFKVCPDGSRIVYAERDGIWITDSVGTPFKRILHSDPFDPGPNPVVEQFVMYPSWHPDGKHIVYVHTDVTRYENCDLGNCPRFEGYVSIRMANVDSLLNINP